MRSVGGGALRKPRARGEIATATAIASVLTESSVYLQGGAPVSRRSAPRASTRSAALRRDRRQRLIDTVVHKHGVGAFNFLFERLEAEVGDLRIDARLEGLINAEPDALALAGAVY
jgi:hypothetical protein